MPQRTPRGPRPTGSRVGRLLTTPAGVLLPRPSLRTRGGRAEVRIRCVRGPREEPPPRRPACRAVHGRAGRPSCRCRSSPLTWPARCRVPARRRPSRTGPPVRRTGCSAMRCQPASRRGRGGRPSGDLAARRPPAGTPRASDIPRVDRTAMTTFLGAYLIDVTYMRCVHRNARIRRAGGRPPGVIMPWASDVDEGRGGRHGPRRRATPPENASRPLLSAGGGSRGRLRSVQWVPDPHPHERRGHGGRSGNRTSLT